MGINGIWWSFLLSETVTVVLAVVYLGIQFLVWISKLFRDKRNY